MRILNKKYAVVVAVLFIVASILSVFFIEANKQTRINFVLNQHLNTLATYYKVLIDRQTTLADETFKTTIEHKKLIELLQEANKAKDSNNQKKLNTLREQLEELLKSEYSILKVKGVLQYHFVFPDNKVFLRMHKPSKYGDDLTKIRIDFNKANTMHKIVRGFSQGRTAHGFRNVYPILINDGKTHLGAVEVSFSSETLQNYLTEMNQLHTHFIVNKSIFKSHAWKRDDLIVKYTQSAEDKNHMLTIGTEHTHEKCIVENTIRIEPIKDQIQNNLKFEKPFAVYTIFEDVARVIAFYPIKHSVTKKTVAWLVSYKPQKIINDMIQSTMYVKAFIVLFLAVIAFFIYFLMTQRQLLNRTVQEKTKSLQETNRELEEREQELEHINENLEHIIKDEINKNKEKDRILFEQSKMASMGEMIGNIAHQWRQPLSAISTSASGMIMQNDLNLLEKNEINEKLEKIIEQSAYLSKTIDDFRDFIRGDSQKETINLNTTIDSFLNLVSSSIKRHEITFINKVSDDLEFEALPNELNQSFINLFNNAKDALDDIKTERIIILKAHHKNNEIIITFHDNAGGIPENIINKIFEPYFTTKHQSQGTGLGLHMVYKMISEGMGGTISVENDTFIHEEKIYTGAKFIISLPIQ